MKKFVMYGAGNIGRGFIGQLFSSAGYKVGFVDINKEVISRLNLDGKYSVYTVTSESTVVDTVNNVYGIDGSDVELVSNEICSADIMATAIGVNVLKFIAKPIALGIEKRAKTDAKPLNIIICENLIGADEYLKGLIIKEIPHLEEYVNNNVGFVEASIGRMVPVMTEEKKAGNPLTVYVEPYNVLPVDKSAFKGEIPSISNLYPYEPFNLFIERKLFMHNMGHALCAYLGYLKKYEFIYQTVSDYEIRYCAYRALTASALALSKETGADVSWLLSHADNLIYRFTNVELGDTVLRVGKDTKRKLSANDRLIGALKLAEKHDIDATYICIGVASGMLFNPESDESSVELSSYVKENGVIKALKEYSDYSGKYSNLIESIYEKLSVGTAIKDVIMDCAKASNGKITV